MDNLQEPDLDAILRSRQQPPLREFIDRQTQSDALGPKVIGAATVIPMTLSQLQFRHPQMTNVPL